MKSFVVITALYAKACSLRRVLTVALLLGLISQTVGCMATACWSKFVATKHVQEIHVPEEVLVGSDGGVALRFPERNTEGSSAYIHYAFFPRAEFQSLLREHLELSPDAAGNDDGAAPWPADRIVRLRVSQSHYWQMGHYGHDATLLKPGSAVLETGGETWPPWCVTVTGYTAHDPSPHAPRPVSTNEAERQSSREAVFLYEFDGRIYRIAVERWEDFEHVDPSPWLIPTVAPCVAIDVVTLPVQLGVGICIGLGWLGLHAAGAV